jgi:esterase/lipase superfamily enzyme
MRHFTDFLATLQTAYPGISISFATHSLGSRFAMNGLRFVRHSGCPKCFGRAVFFAPDVDSATLHSELVASKLCDGPPVVHPRTSAPITMYVSNKDLALRESQRVHGHQRAGQAGSELVLCDGVDTIDVSYRSGFDRAGHSYQTNAAVLADAASAEAGFPPTSPRRNLKAVNREGGRYYELRDEPSKK